MSFYFCEVLEQQKTIQILTSKGYVVLWCSRLEFQLLHDAACRVAYIGGISLTERSL